MHVGRMPRVYWLVAAGLGLAMVATVAYLTCHRAKLGAEERADAIPEPEPPTEIVPNPDPWATEDKRPPRTRMESADGTMTVFPVGGTTAMPWVELRPMRRLLSGKLVALDFTLLRLHRVDEQWNNGYQFDESHPALRLGAQEQQTLRNLAFGATYELEGYTLKPRFTVPKEIGRRMIARFELVAEDQSKPAKPASTPR